MPRWPAARKKIGPTRGWGFGQPCLRAPEKTPKMGGWPANLPGPKGRRAPPQFRSLHESWGRKCSWRGKVTGPFVRKNRAGPLHRTLRFAGGPPCRTRPPRTQKNVCRQIWTFCFPLTSTGRGKAGGTWLLVRYVELVFVIRPFKLVAVPDPSPTIFPWRTPSKY